METDNRVIGIPWYSSEDYGRILQMMKDADRMPPTFDHWLRLANELCRDCRNAGIIIKKIVIHPDRFQSWCDERGLELDAHARQRFGNEALEKTPAVSLR